MKQYDCVKVKSRKLRGIVMHPATDDTMLNNVRLEDGTTMMCREDDLEVQNGRTKKVAKQIKELYD